MNTSKFQPNRIVKICKALFIMLTFSQTISYAQSCDAASYLMQTTTVNSCSGYIYDSGGGAGNYSNSENYTFSINPAGATKIYINFSEFNTERGYDFLTITNAATGAVIMPRRSGNAIPAEITCRGLTAGINVIFSSDGGVVKSGFVLLWTSVGGSCGPEYNMPNASLIDYRGTLYDDGGRNGNYSNFQTKLVNIVPPNASFVCLNFSQFNLGEGDILNVYEGVNATGNFKTYSSSYKPSGYYYFDGKLSITFSTNYTSVSSGFIAHWNSDGDYPFANGQGARSLVQGEEVTSENKIGVFPNPTDSKIAITFNVEDDMPTKVIIYNIAGMETVVLDKTLTKGLQKIDFDATSFAPGMYFCKVIMGNTVLTEKIIKN